MGKMRRCVPEKNTMLIDKTIHFFCSLFFLLLPSLPLPKYSSILHSPPVRNNSHLDFLKKEMTYVQPVFPTEGRLGHLTPSRPRCCKKFWIRLHDIFVGKTPFDQTVPSSFKGQARDEEGTAPKVG